MLLASFSAVCHNSSLRLSSQSSSSLGFLFHFQFHTSELSAHLELAQAGTNSNCPATFDTVLIQPLRNLTFFFYSGFYLVKTDGECLPLVVAEITTSPDSNKISSLKWCKTWQGRKESVWLLREKFTSSVSTSGAVDNVKFTCCKRMPVIMFCFCASNLVK